MDERVRAASGSLWMTSSGIASGLIAFLILIRLTWHLPKETFGVWTFVVSAAAFAYLFSDLGLDGLVTYFIQRYWGKDSDRARIAYRVGTRLKILLAVFSVLGTATLGIFLSPSFFLATLLLVGLIPYIYLLSILQSLQEFRFYAGIQILESLLRLGLVEFYVRLPGKELETLAYLYTIPYLLAALLALLRCRLGGRASGRSFSAVQEEAWAYWRWFGLFAVSTPVIAHGQHLVLGFFRMLTDLADYGVAISISGALVLVSMAVRLSLQPSFLKKDDPENLRLSLEESFRYTALIVVFFFAFIHFNSELIVLRFFSERYVGVPLNLEIASLGLLTAVVTAGLPPTTLNRGRPDIRVKSMGLGAVISMSAGVLLVPYLGSLGASVSFALGHMTGGLYYAWSTYRLLPFAFPISSLLRGSGAALATFLPLQLLALPPLAHLALQFFGGVGLYLLVLRVFGELKNRDVELLRDTLRALVSR